MLQRELRRAGLRAVAGGVILAACYGPRGWPFVGLALALGGLLAGRGLGPRPSSGRIIEAGLLAATLGAFGTAGALFNGVYLGALRTGGVAAAGADLHAAWLAAVEPGRSDPLAPGLPWYPLWVWTRTSGCALATAVVLGLLLGATTAAGLVLGRWSERAAAWGAGLCGGLCAAIVGLFLVPDLPPETTYESLQGFGEFVRFVGLPLLAGVALALADGLDGAWGPRSEVEVPAVETPARRGPRPGVVLGCVLAWLALWALLVGGPRRARGPGAEEALGAALANPGPARVQALAAVGSDALLLRDLWRQVLPSLGDPDPAVRAQAVQALGQTPAANAEVATALLALVEHDPDPGVRAGAARVTGLFARWGAPVDASRLRRCRESEQEPQVRAALEEALAFCP